MAIAHKFLKIVVCFTIVLSFQLNSVSYSPVTIAQNNPDGVDMMAKASPMVLPVEGKGVIEFTASVTPGNNLYKPGLIMSPTQKSVPEEGITKLIVSMADNMDGTHVNGKEAYFVQQTPANHGFLVQKFSTVPLKGAGKLAVLPVAVTDKGQATQFKVVVDATVLPNIFQVYAKKPSSSSYPAKPYFEYSNWGANQLFTLGGKGKTFFYFSGSPYCDVTYSNISVTPLDVEVKPPLGPTVVIKPNDDDLFKSTPVSLPVAGKGVIEFTVSAGVDTNLYCPGIVLSSTPNGKPETGVTKLFVNISGNMDGDHVNGKEASLVQQTIVNHGFLQQLFNSVPLDGSAPTRDPLPVEATSRGQVAMFKVVIDATVLPNVLQVYAKTPSDAAYPEVPYFEFSNLGATQLFSVDPDGKTYVGFLGNPYWNLAYSGISVTPLDAPVAQKNGPVFGIAAGDSDNFTGMSTATPITLPEPGRGSIELLASAGVGENIYRAGIILSRTQNGDMENGVNKLIVVVGDNMDGGNVNGKEAYLLQRTPDDAGRLLKGYSIVGDGAKAPTLASPPPVENLKNGQGLMLRFDIDAISKPNTVRVYAKKPSAATYPTTPYFEYTAANNQQLFSVDPKGKTYVYFTGGPYSNIAYSKVVTSPLNGAVQPQSTSSPQKTAVTQPAPVVPQVVPAPQQPEAIAVASSAPVSPATVATALPQLVVSPTAASAPQEVSASEQSVVVSAVPSASVVTPAPSTTVPILPQLVIPAQSASQQVTPPAPTLPQLVVPETQPVQSVSPVPEVLPQPVTATAQEPVRSVLPALIVPPSASTIAATPPSQQRTLPPLVVTPVAPAQSQFVTVPQVQQASAPAPTVPDATSISAEPTISGSQQLPAPASQSVSQPAVVQAAPGGFKSEPVVAKPSAIRTELDVVAPKVNLGEFAHFEI